MLQDPFICSVVLKKPDCYVSIKIALIYITQVSFVSAEKTRIPGLVAIPVLKLIIGQKHHPPRFHLHVYGHYRKINGNQMQNAIEEDT
jgi:hypothetical protein